jgi:hypothetical protein
MRQFVVDAALEEDMPMIADIVKNIKEGCNLIE